ncbi:MAG: hypothetical protein Q9O62_03065 [Ardenticatenia bacterium]|nr:hypothetical protein [Ardenticatenia bacterium]
MARSRLTGPMWRFGPVPPRPPATPVDDRVAVHPWRPARVPGHVQADLADHGLLPDVNQRDHVALYDQANAHDWWYERPVRLALKPGERAFVRFLGIDYLADIWWDGLHLARHEGQFVDLWAEITDTVPRDGRPREHTLGVRLWGAHAWPQPQWPLLDRLWRPLAERLIATPLRPYHHRLGLVRSQVSFGWDFAPPCLAPGIWDDVWLLVTGDVLIRDAWVHGDPRQPRLQLELDATRPQQVGVEVVWWERDGREQGHLHTAAEVRPGVRTVEVILPVERPRLWWPWEHGQPHLYSLRVRVLEAGHVSDELEITFGLRQIAWDGVHLLVNGTRTFIRGVNWVPASLLPGRLTEADYAPLLRRARELGVNTVRVWGGGLREKRAFYELCDRLGILVWQEFPFACGVCRPVSSRSRVPGARRADGCLHSESPARPPLIGHLVRRQRIQPPPQSATGGAPGPRRGRTRRHTSLSSSFPRPRRDPQLVRVARDGASSRLFGRTHPSGQRVRPPSSAGHRNAHRRGG